MHVNPNRKQLGTGSNHSYRNVTRNMHQTAERSVAHANGIAKPGIWHAIHTNLEALIHLDCARTRGFEDRRCLTRVP